MSPGLHHVWVGATGGWDYFRDEVDRVSWVRFLAQTISEMSWTCLGFCQMSSHVHAFLDVTDSSLAIGMRELNREYSCAFNGRHRRVGTFVRQRFGSRRIRDAADALTVYSYVVLNPVAGGLCLRPEEWRWSSYRTSLGIAADFPFVDASPVIAEAGGSVRELRRAVESMATYRRERTRPEPGSGRVPRS